MQKRGSVNSKFESSQPSPLQSASYPITVTASATEAVPATDQLTLTVHP